MKKTLLSIAAAGVLLSACSPKLYTYYQVYETQTPESSVQPDSSDNGIVFEDQNCTVVYDLWSEGGNAGFSVYNKTDNIIYIKLSQSFFIKNGVAHDYYRNRAWSASQHFSTTSEKGFAIASQKSSLAGAYASTSSTTSSSNSSETVYEMAVIAIPPHSMKFFAEQTITSTTFTDCDFDRFPSEKSTISFTYDNTPLQFKNHLTYNLGENTPDITLSHEFYVSAIYNIPSSKAFTMKERTSKPCQNKTNDPSKNYSTQYPSYVHVYDQFWTVKEPSRFYLIYEIKSTRKLFESDGNYYYSNEYQGYTKTQSR